MRKGQIHSQLLVYIATGVVVLLVFIFGFMAFGSFQKRQREATVIDLEEKLKSMVDLSSGEYGTIKKVELKVPTDVDKVCFLDLSKREELKKSFISQAYPDIREMLSDNTVAENVFLLSGNSITDALDVGNICLPTPYYVCIETPDNYLRFLVEGMGGCVNIIKPISGLAIHNTKNLNKYESGLVFLAPDEYEEGAEIPPLRQMILQYIPIAMWNDQSGGIINYPFISFYEGETPTSSPQEMVQNINAYYKKPLTRLRFSLTKPTSFSTIDCPPDKYGPITIPGDDYYCMTEDITDPTTYYSYWDHLEDVVVVSSGNQEGALMASLLSSYLIAPLIFAGTDKTFVDAITNKRVYIIDNLPSDTLKLLASNSKEMIQYGSNYLRMNEELNPYRKIISNVIIVN